MLSVSALNRRELGARLAGPGILLRTGCFTTHVHSDVASVADGIALLYADYPLQEPGTFADFHVGIHHVRGLRRFVRPQVVCTFDRKPMFEPMPLAQAFPVFEWGMNWCISSMAHSYLMVHAAVVEKDGFAAILPAPPGSGKSTLCAALVHNGWRLLSDELTLMRRQDSRIAPLPRPVSLKNRSIEVIRGYVPNTMFSPAVHDTAKGTVAHLRAPADSVARAGETATPGWIVFPRYQAGSPAVLEPIARARAFMRVAENSFNYSLLGADGFATLAGVVERADAYDFTYSALDDAMDVFSKLKAHSAS
jgi:hypothetical protein